MTDKKKTLAERLGPGWEQQGWSAQHKASAVEVGHRYDASGYWANGDALAFGTTPEDALRALADEVQRKVNAIRASLLRFEWNDVGDGYWDGRCDGPIHYLAGPDGYWSLCTGDGVIFARGTATDLASAKAAAEQAVRDYVAGGGR